MSGSGLPLSRPGPRTRHRAVVRILRSKIHDASKLLEMRDVQRFMQRGDPKEITATLSELGRRQRWHDALFAMAHLGRSRLPIQACNAVITCCGSSGPWQMSMELLRAAAALSLQHSLVTAGAAIKAAGVEQEMAGQPAWFNSILQMSRMRERGMSPDIRHFNNVLSCQQDWPTALCIFESTQELEIKPTEVTGSLLIGRLDANWQLAIRAFLSLQGLRLRHDAITVNTALRAASSQRRVAQEFVQHLMSAGVPVDSATCSSAGSTLDAENVLDLLQEVKRSSQEPDVGAYTSAVAALGNDGRWEAAVVYLRSMALDGIQAHGSKSSTSVAKPDPMTCKDNVNSYAAAQGACERCQQWMEVIHLVRALKSSTVRLDLVVRSATISASQAGLRLSISNIS